MSTKNHNELSLPLVLRCTYSKTAKVKETIRQSLFPQMYHWRHSDNLNDFNILQRNVLLCFSEFCLCGSKATKRRHSGFLCARVVSWCATAYHVSAALEGFSRTSAMSLDALRALPSSTVFPLWQILDYNVSVCTSATVHTSLRGRAQTS